ncbi:T6SS effector BTH_I2691 family protein [Burkholderia gladioli]|uniref:T6SS effector BTH_I2691 family protein n=1 Tax=Burkholderia gladioli TaxID=28095 RepID=UPI00164217FC|nr:T6SS effector BTH_I2691 family protein [Burkholderia gladioli]
MSIRKGCPICDRDSLLIYPVRYAIACPRGAAKVPALSGNFRVDDLAPQDVATARYTLRSLRGGYLYTYDEKRKLLRAYMVTGDGTLWKFPPGIAPPPGNSAKYNLTANLCPFGDDYPQSYGLCVSIQHTPGDDEATKLWIGWSNVRWTRDMVFKKIEDIAWRKLHMQCIDVSAMIAGGAAHTGEFEAVRGGISHFAMDHHAMAEAFDFSNRAPNDDIRLRQSHADARIAKVMAESPLKQGFVIAVNDPVGIANDLAELTIPDSHNGFDTGIYWKYVSAQLLERAEAGIRANAKASAGLGYGISKRIADANALNAVVRAPGEPAADLAGLYRFVRRWIATGSAGRAARAEQRKIDDIPTAELEAADEAWAAACARMGPDGKPLIGRDGKPVSVIDKQALERFRKDEYPRALDAFKPGWLALVQAHAEWLKCRLLADWMTGNHDMRDLRSGYAYSESCAQSIGAAAGTQACRKELDDWLNGQASDTHNLYVRALLFNQETLMAAADAQVRGSDIQYENILNLYKASIEKIEQFGTAGNLRDRLVVTTANTIVDVLAKGARGVAAGFVTIRLSMHAGVSIKAAGLTPIEMRTWVLKQGEALGLKLDGDRLARQAAAANIRREVFKAAPPSDPAVFAYAIDTDAWVRAGKLEASEVKAIKLPGVDVTRKWLGASSPVEFHQGVATAIFQLVALRFAYADFNESDRFNYDETLLKLTGSVVAILGNIVETVSETFIKAPVHPLSDFIMKHWAWFNRKTAGVAAHGGRWIGALAGVFVSGVDLFEKAPGALRNHEKNVVGLYLSSGILGMYIALSPAVSSIPLIGAWLPPLWPILVVSIAIGVVVVHVESTAIVEWVALCKFSKTPAYRSLDEELKAFNFAVER